MHRDQRRMVEEVSWTLIGGGRDRRWPQPSTQSTCVAMASKAHSGAPTLACVGAVDAVPIMSHSPEACSRGARDSSAREGEGERDLQCAKPSCPVPHSAVSARLCRCILNSIVIMCATHVHTTYRGRCRRTNLMRLPRAEKLRNEENEVKGKRPAGHFLLRLLTASKHTLTQHGVRTMHMHRRGNGRRTSTPSIDAPVRSPTPPLCSRIPCHVPLPTTQAPRREVGAEAGQSELFFSWDPERGRDPRSMISIH